MLFHVHCGAWLCLSICRRSLRVPRCVRRRQKVVRGGLRRRKYTRQRRLLGFLCDRDWVLLLWNVGWKELLHMPSAKGHADHWDFPIAHVPLPARVPRNTDRAVCSMFARVFQGGVPASDRCGLSELSIGALWIVPRKLLQHGAGPKRVPGMSVQCNCTGRQFKGRGLPVQGWLLLVAR